MKKDFIAMKKNLCYIALAIIAMTGCTSNDYIGDQEKLEAGISRPISFGFDVPTPTRATGSDAATALGNQFIVYGEKGPITNAAPADGNYVFPNYQVNYIDNSSNTTTSNTKGWEYVGYTHSDNYQANITTKATLEAGAVPAHSSVQTIKFWDYGAANYVFTAVSALKDDIENGRVKIQKNEFGTTEYDKGYTITLAKSGSDPYVYPTVNKLFFADRIAIAQSSNSDRSQVNQYGGNVTFNFRNLVSHIRAGIYETIPGYDITDIKFFVTGDVEAKVSETSAFGAVCPNNKTNDYEGIITVTYYSATEGNENQPKVTQSVGAATDLILGTNLSSLNKTTPTLLGKTATAPTWDTDGGAFTEVFPQINNATNLKLKCDYTLWNSVTHETIKVTGATAEVPAMYLQWKPNYKYTYLFKISDNTNGSTGQGVVGLFPITFDAIEIAADDGKVEYITTVTEPSITTFGVKGGKYVAGKNEYEAGSDIYATFMNGSSVQKPSLTETTKANYVQIYSVTTTDATNFPITETSVAERLATTPSGTAKLTCTNITTDATDTYFNSVAPAVVETVPSEDGKTKTIDALKLTGVKAGTYAIEIVTYDSGTVLTTEQSKVGYYSQSDGVYTLQGEGNGDGSTTYYKQVKTYKVITVVAAP